MFDETALSRSMPGVKALLAATFPSYRGRTIKARTQETVDFFDSYWDGGSRTVYVLVNIESGQIMPLRSLEAPWSATADQKRERRPLPKNALIAEHVVFCGRDLGVRFIVHPDTLGAFTARLESGQVFAPLPPAIGPQVALPA